MELKIISLCCVIALASSSSLKFKKSTVPNDFMDMVKRYGYPIESYDVQTEDGYILELFHIPQRDNVRTQKHLSPDSSSEKEMRAVFLMHGMLTNAESFVYGGPTEGLAFYLSDAGYDVFLGNARGSMYGQRHTTLNPKTDAAFWRFCWHQIGVMDMPALVDKALSVSGQRTMSYIGHNEGTTAFYVMLSERPEYNNKFDRQISLGPVAFMKNTQDEVIENVESHLSSKSWLMKNLGMSTFTPSNELLQTAQESCKSGGYMEQMCNNAYFLVNGYNSKNLNETTLNQLMSRVPSTGSVREIIHYAQMMANGHFQTYEEDSPPRDYDMSKITVPMAMMYTPNDPLSNVQDVEILMGKLPRVYMKHNFQQLTNNLDLMYSKNMMNVQKQIEKALQDNPSQGYSGQENSAGMSSRYWQ